MAENDTKVKSPSRLRRVKRLKRIIVISVLVIIFVPLALCIYFGCMAFTLKADLERAREDLNFYLEQDSVEEYIEASKDMQQLQATEPEEVKTERKRETINLSGDQVKTLSLSDEELYDGYRKVYLTFDDGPSPNTEDILDCLNKYGVKATFFVVRRDGRNYEKLYQRIVDEGHSLGMHSTSHVYSEIYSDVDSFMADTLNLRDFLYMVSGTESDIYRFPGGSSNRAGAADMNDLADALYSEGILYFDWNISSQDATAGGLSKDAIVRNVINRIEDSGDEAIILFHDLSSKVTTVEALPEIIEYIQSLDNTVILPITRDTNPIHFLSVKEN